MIKVISSFFFLMVLVSAGAVYSTKEAAENLEVQKRLLSAKILKDRAAIKVLRAEMAYLSQPARLKKLSNRFLALSPYGSYQMAHNINSIAARGEAVRVSIPLDEFPLLLPQEKPRFQESRYKEPLVQVAYEPKAIEKKTMLKSPKKSNRNIKKIGFYERMSLKLEKGE